MTIDNKNDLDNVSPFFEIKQTSWGGRACFSKCALPAGTPILEINNCIGSSLSYEFRKEVCHFCYFYHNGHTLKYRLEKEHLKFMENCNDKENGEGKKSTRMNNKAKFQGAGLWFCSELCRSKFIKQPHIWELVQCYEILWCNLQKMFKRENPDDVTGREEQLNSIIITEDVIQRSWDDCQHNWIPRIDKMSAAKKLHNLPVISEDEYCCAKFVCESLFRLKYIDSDSITKKCFNGLQSNELSKIHEFPVLLHFQELVFKTLYILLPDYLRTQLTIENFRHIVGSEYGNAFGIWETGETPESREWFGFEVLPEASYFNHSCKPNITKTREGRTMEFTLNSNVAKGTEICIDYSGVLDLPTKKRRKFLHDTWFFDCLCVRCKSEM
ncbi:Set6p NDAI_0K01280 [Naumovozyma dairenensis CBS 421]|uniref:SET domain-containing protein n=1 Tax=Naumovozyma dairenensis (strain ATCC 10597 / BCRC 20456 / CBS 421 / NBRC 0211 / NRRL Y-12639) TaxID=1071378 RepID=G0WHQ8_NAUDC|nr:hypothetical protein NDAI_0K01280 [Naumovozyma dairenensis CBS 421]CCD27319.1 hypothetical protein NDAI_0K01280 [Naumovozyma dairenensis CBS 421]